ncbi:MAG: UDP-N-acetylmuramoyl-L-alanine--D-glutamate ligase [Eubacteriales bacterium]|nr:UDP-N-acetylmuramoyl-L-alanine--D-glutamate ligase [Eubacteriales bacterium]
MDFTGTRALVIGTGISGLSAVSLLERQGAQVTLYDANEKLTGEQVRGKLKAGSRARIRIGGDWERELDGTTLVVPSPGVPMDIPMMKAVLERGIPVWGEIELGYRCGRGPVAAITGTNGKTTTTTLVGEILGSYYPHTYVVGNIGKPYADVADGMEEDAVTAAEISSFMLESIVKFRPKVSAILNVTPDHLNRHHTMENYVAAKERIAENQTKEDTCVLNYDDAVLREYAEKCPADVLFFSRLHRLEQGVDLEDGWLVLRDGGTEERICRTEELHILGGHNHENAMAAIAVAHRMGVPSDVIRRALLSFRAVEHRIEFVEEIGGVAYYNDSKGTNPDAAIKGIRAMDRSTHLIGGGYDKGSEYDEWIEAFDGKVKTLVLIGATAPKIASCACAHGFSPVVTVPSLEEAVRECAKRAVPGDAVLLSPACASWDMFESFEQRGTLFKKYVRDLMV